MIARSTVAYHEAGHVWAAWRHGARVRCASCLREQDGSEGLVIPDGLPRDALIDFYVGGAAAEAVMREQSFDRVWPPYAGQPGDGLAALGAARAIGRFGAEASAIVLERGRAVTAELRGARDVLAAVAEALYAHGQLDARQLADLARACGMPSSAWRG